MKIIKNTILTLMILFTAGAINSQYSHAQFIAPVGTSTKASTQLVYWYDGTNDGLSDQNLHSVIQVTNTNDTSGVWIHVQVFRSFDPTDQLGDNGNSDKSAVVRCDERDFVDFLTPNDTHSYLIVSEVPTVGDTTIFKNSGETAVAHGESTSLNLSDTKGFIIITPVVSEADLSAISFQHMIGTTIVPGFGGANTGSFQSFRVNAMGRDAVDFTTGENPADGTPLDGVTNGLLVLQPDELSFNFLQTNDDGAEAYIVGITFIDSYGPPGLLGYNVAPGETNWTSFIYDWKEDPTSCGNRTNSCFFSIGVNEDIGDADNELDVNELLCSAVDTPGYPGGPVDTAIGFTKISVSGYDQFENQIALAAFQERGQGGADWVYTDGERTEPAPEPMEEDCAVEGDEDEDGFADCLDTDCATAEECETGETECADGMDNDGDGQADCADLGCDGFAGCEFGTETSCNDGIDNDADGDVDGADSDCQASDDGGTTGGDGGDGGGCTVASAVTASTAAANFLLPLLPLFGAYGIRRIRKVN